ncbi:MAG: hypothetical protein AAGU32_04810 [Bacillota bacterium]
MAELKFETGLVTFEVNGNTEISFNPTDSNFVERLFNTFDTLDKKQESYKAEIERMTDKREIFKIARARDAEIRELIDAIFERPVCADIFGGVNVYALADGLPVWCNFLLAVMDEVDTTFAREQKATNPRIAKYTAKYRK